MTTQVIDTHEVELQKSNNRFAQRVLQADGIFELVVGTGLILESETVARWFGSNPTLILASGIGVLIFGGWLLYLAQHAVLRPTLQRMAVLNLAGVVVFIVLLMLDWSAIANEGRWLIAFLADGFVVLGLAEIYAQRNAA